MLYVGTDQYRKQLTVSVRDESGNVLLRRQVSTEWKKVRAFFDEVRALAVPHGGYLAVVEGRCHPKPRERLGKMGNFRQFLTPGIVLDPHEHPSAESPSKTGSPFGGMGVDVRGSGRSFRQRAQRQDYPAERHTWQVNKPSPRELWA